MRIGIGLPNSIPGATGGLMRAWGAHAEACGFASLGAVDRVGYPGFDPVVSLGNAAAVTRRLRLVTSILIAPLRRTRLLARELLSLQALSDNRLVLGLGAGARSEDFELAGVAPGARGRVLSEQLAALRDLFERPEGLAPGPDVKPPPLLVGGASGAAFSRVARFADGYVFGGGPPRLFERAAGSVRHAWADAQRIGRPELFAMSYFGLSRRERGRAYLESYYAFVGRAAARIAAQALWTPQGILHFVEAYRRAGCDHLILFPTVSDLDEVERLADVVSHELGAGDG